MKDQWFIARYEASLHALHQLNMMNKDRSDDEYKALDDWISKYEDRYVKLVL